MSEEQSGEGWLLRVLELLCDGCVPMVMVMIVVCILSLCLVPFVPCVRDFWEEIRVEHKDVEFEER